ncbi:oxidoreductase, zinc-binding dehydrogenase family protein [Carex rostrata]
MVKTVVADETQLKSTEDSLFQSGSAPLSVQVGLVIGKLSASSDRGQVYALIPTPLTDGGDPACSLRSDGGGGARDEKKKSGSKKPSNEVPQSIEIDGDWVAEHARQVSKMLLGGMDVVGIYIWASEASFKATSTAIFCQVIRGVAQAAPWSDTQFDERLLIHISYAPRRWACRICNWNSGSLRPCDLKLSKVVTSLKEFRCMYNFEVRLPIDQASLPNHKSFKNVVTKGITHLSNKLQTAKALLDGNMVEDNLSLTTEGPHNIELLLPFEIESNSEESSLEDVAGLVLFSGSVCASAYLGPRESVAQAISDLKGDIIASLRSRLDLMLDEAEGEDAQSEKSIGQLNFHELKKNFRVSFPRRVLVPWVAGIHICDYLQSSEILEDTKDRCKEMMSMEDTIDTSSILEIESQSEPTTVEKSFWHVVTGTDLPVQNNYLKKKNSSSSSKGSNLYFLVALFVLLLAVFAGLGLTFFASHK